VRVANEAAELDAAGTITLLNDENGVMVPTPLSIPKEQVTLLAVLPDPTGFSKVMVASIEKLPSPSELSERPAT
jgi:hypothetical protein